MQQEQLFLHLTQSEEVPFVFKLFEEIIYVKENHKGCHFDY